MVSNELKKSIEERIKRLCKIDSEKECSKSNCHGTLLYLVGFQNRSKPDLVFEEEMKKFYDESCIRLGPSQRIEYDFVTLWTRYHKDTLDGPLIWHLEHSSILIDSASERIFHQRDTGLEFEFNTINVYIQENFKVFRKRDVNLFVRYHRLDETKLH